MAAKRRSRRTRKSTTPSGTAGASRKGKRTAKRSPKSNASAARGTRATDLAKRVQGTAKKVLFGTLGVAGYVKDIAQQRRRQAAAGRTVKPVPDGYHTVTPYLIVRDVPRLIAFVQQAFGASENSRMTLPDGRVMHAEVSIGDSRVMMGEASAEWAPMPACIHLYAADSDALYHLALQAGATSLREPTNEFYGDRMAGVQDPLGNQWWIATHVEDVSPEEVAFRALQQRK